MSSPLLDRRLLQAFVTLVDQGSPSSAAALLGITQSSLIGMLRELEDSTGMQMLHSSDPSASLTRCGQDFLGQARRVLDSTEGMTVGTCPPMSAGSIPPAVQRPVYVSQDQHSASIVETLLEFACTVSSAKSAIFYWVGPDCEMVDTQHLNVRHDTMQHYYAHMRDRDPLDIRRLKSSGTRIANLRGGSFLTSVAESFEYEDYLKRIGVEDEIDLVFWNNNVPLACLCLLRPVGDSPFSVESFNWKAMHLHLQSTIEAHWRTRSVKVERALVDKFGLKPRELQVVEHLLNGKSNSQIGEILGISVATVKSHIVNIMDKTGLDSRFAIVTLVNRVQYA